MGETFSDTKSAIKWLTQPSNEHTTAKSTPSRRISRKKRGICAAKNLRRWSRSAKVHMERCTKPNGKRPTGGTLKRNVNVELTAERKPRVAGTGGHHPKEGKEIADGELTHDNIVRTFGWILDELPCSMVMEYMDDGSTKRRVRNAPWQAICAVEYVHSRGVVHADLAARNCLVRGDTLKLGDFGVATDHPPRKIKLEGGFRRYAPEVFESAQLTTETDVFAYGLLLWELFHPKELPPDLYDQMDGKKGQGRGDQRLPPPTASIHAAHHPSPSTKDLGPETPSRA
ncbi:unnamed protein product [Bursaphelenchus xylophilus]|uniref:(pine wood nematode) hypothetical protein n=1 Tax=Bursaphelenchus xylophilus TaxID=6326 RepID=A0A811KBR5_BURXY|nr:unnamed protein product [Bursaphelenchus xylophilus]CAG9092016.1 unnamed protein product [Bursaphelenchus xylophilus]